MPKIVLTNNRGIALLVTISIITVLIAGVLEWNRKVRASVVMSATARDRLTLAAMASSGVQAAMTLLVKDKMIISDGYNGTPSGFENICEDEDNRSKPYVLHAEANAITKIAKSNNSSDGATLYVTSSPCLECSKLIIQAGIKRVVFTENYRLEDGLNLLKRANIEVVRVETESLN